VSRIRRVISSLSRPEAAAAAAQDTSNNAAPQTYSQWCRLLDEIVASPRNEDYIEVVRKGSVSWTSGVAERFVQSVADMIRKRVNNAVDVYQRQMKNSRYGETDISRALQVLAKEYRYLYQMSQALPIPEKYVKELSDLVQEDADRTNQSLTDSARSDHSGRLGAIVRSAGVNKLSGRS